MLALRVRGFKSIGAYPDFIYFGGNSEMRGYDYLQFVGQNVVFANAELRFPIIEAALTPIGVVGGIRGVFFANIGGGSFQGQNFTFATNKSEVIYAVLGYEHRPWRGNAGAGLRTATDDRRVPPGGRPRLLRLRPRDLRARLPDSLRLGVAHAVQPGLGRRAVRRGRRQIEFRKARFAVWIGYDF